MFVLLQTFSKVIVLFELYLSIISSINMLTNDVSINRE